MFALTRSPARRTVSAIIVASLLAAACTSDGGDDSTATEAVDVTAQPEPSTTAPTVETTEADPGDDASVPLELSGLDGAIGEASDLVLSWFNGATFDESAYEASFDVTFRDAVGFEEMTPLLDQLRLESPFEVREIQRSTPTEADLIIVGASGERALLAIAVVSADDPTMSGLFIGPAVQPTFDVPATTDDAIARLQALGTTRIGAFDANCAAIDGDVSLAADEQAPIGSGFKLWVLHAVVDAVTAGSITWDDEITIRDELDSIPSGITQNDEPGATVTVRELAERMIEISDNTATDHLIDLVGRAAVEEAFASTGHTAPERNQPLLTTREFTIVKFTDDDLRARFQASDEAERRRILAEEVAAMPLPPLTNITSVTDPLDVETLEWFASPSDLCRVLAALADDDEASAILARNPGVPDETGTWETILFKGGSEPGVFAMAWLVIDADGNRSVVAGSVANESALIDEFEAANLMAHLRDTIA